MGRKKMTFDTIKEEGFNSADLTDFFSGGFDKPEPPKEIKDEMASMLKKEVEPSTLAPSSTPIDTNVTEATSDNKKEILKEKVQQYVEMIPITSLVSYHEHPFKVRDDEDMDILVDSIRQYGNVIVPLSVREIGEDKYEILAGHRRKHAAEIVGLKELPCIIFDVDDNTADIIMVDSNAQRTVTPSERANSYRIKLEALKARGKVDGLFENAEEESSKTPDDFALDQLAKDADIGRTQISKYLRLAELNSYLQDLVDDGKRLGITSGYVLSFLSKINQLTLTNVLKNNEKYSVSLKQAVALRKYCDTDQRFTEDVAIDIMDGKRNVRGAYAGTPKVKFNEKTFREYFPKQVAEASPEKRISYIKNAMEFYNAYLEEHPESLDLSDL